MKIIKLDEIKNILKSIDLLPIIEAGFVAYSNHEAIVPPVGELLFENPPGDLHIKYGYLKNDKYYVVKIASGFYENYKLNLPSTDGLMLLFDQKNGALLCILLDECYLTNIRTAVAGAIAAKYFSPKNIHGIGIVGTGIQAELQLIFLKQITSCKKIFVWGRNENNLKNFQKKLSQEGFQMQVTQDISELCSNCNLIVTTTPSKNPILNSKDIRKGTHITAVGSDTPEKQELAAEILSKADLIIADSISQCQIRGEISHALNKKLISNNQIIELGDVISGKKQGRTSEEQISVVDLTGVAVQDIQIAKAVFEGL